MNKNYKRVLITGGCGFIGSALIRNLLHETNLEIFNIDKIGYASDIQSVENIFNKFPAYKKRYYFFQIDLLNKENLEDLIMKIKPNIVMHLAAESHVDNSISDPSKFVFNNIIGTTNLLEVLLDYWKSLIPIDKKIFRFLHVSTDEVFGSLNNQGKFSETSPYQPNSPYSASKAASDHFVRSWFKTYKFPVITTNCSNNFGPWQFPEKLIPLIIMKCIKKESIPIYGKGQNIRDWIYVDDHINALKKCTFNGNIGESYCIGGDNEISNLNIAELICSFMNQKLSWHKPYSSLITFVEDRLGHDYRYAIDSTKIKKELNWRPNFEFQNALRNTVQWYLENEKWLLNKI